MKTSIEHRIESLSPKAKELLLKKVSNLAKSSAKLNSSKQIVAYITKKEGFDLEALKSDLKKTLPNYMLPSSIKIIDEMPLLPNGKIDRKNLSLQPTSSNKTAETSTELSQTEQTLIKIWEEVLGFSPITNTDNFFEIGGDSILSIQIVTKAKKAGIDLSSNEIFENQTIKDLSSIITISESQQNEHIADTENLMIQIWEEVLGFSPITNTDNFFEIGGDSILSIQIVAKAKKAGIDLSSNAIFESQTIQELSSTLKAPQNQYKNQINSVEQQLISIWENILGFSPISNTDNFFEIGGDSILSIQIIAQAKKVGLTLKSNDIFEHQTIQELASNLALSQKNTSDSSAIEFILTPIWEKVLGFAPISTTDNFFEIGGDSILSIQIIAEARKKGISINANDIFKHQNISELSQVAQAISEQSNTTIYTGKTNLTPIQHWFFKHHKNAPSYWNQAAKLENIPSLSKDTLNTITHSLISNHDALRTSFVKNGEQWEAQILSPESSVALEYIDITNLEVSKHKSFQEEQLAKIQNEFTLSKGSLFKCIYFYSHNANTSFCVLLAHHLVVDAVSWQIIIDQFTEALDGGTTNEIKTTSVKDWSDFLKNTSFNSEIEYWNNQIKFSQSLPYDIENPAIIEEKDIETKSFSLNDDITNLLKGKANKSYNTKIDELITAAFVGTINSWTKFNEFTIGFEKHGRATSLNNSLDLSKTVGWLTSFFPIKFNSEYLSDGDISKLIINTKEKMRNIPNDGVGFGVLKYLKNSFKNTDEPEIVFNYLGNVNNSNKPITITPLSEKLRADSSERTYKFEINASIKNNQFHCNWSYSKKMYHPETIDLLINSFEQKLNIIVNHCVQSETVNYSPSDFTEVDISQNDLDSLLNLLD